jgi:hypothetical protein
VITVVLRDTRAIKAHLVHRAVSATKASEAIKATKVESVLRGTKAIKVRSEDRKDIREIKAIKEFQGTKA